MMQQLALILAVCNDKNNNNKSRLQRYRAYPTAICLHNKVTRQEK